MISETQRHQNIIKMEQNTSKSEALTSLKQQPSSMKDREITGKRFGRGAIGSGLTHECGVFGVVATGKWPSSNVSSLSFFYLNTLYLFEIHSRLTLHKLFVLVLLLYNIVDKNQPVSSQAKGMTRRTLIFIKEWE